MSINKTYAVIGLGRYGASVALELVNSGAEVLAIDKDENIVNELAREIPLCKCADICDEEVFAQLGMDRIDVAIISMADSLEASVMAITLCKDAGVSTVIVKCGSEMQAKIYTNVGADRTVFPEKESGTRLAKNILSNGFMDIVELSKDVSMVEIPVNTEWVGKNLVELKLRKKYGLNVVAIVKSAEVITEINPEMPMDNDMKLIVIANVNKLKKMY